jgi:hypothetical protein
VEFEAEQIIVFTNSEQDPCLDCSSIMLVGGTGEPNRLGIQEQDVPLLIKDLAAAIGIEVAFPAADRSHSQLRQ